MAVAPARTIPPEGLPMPPTETEATASPTTMVLNYLQSRGYQPTSENVRRALEANAKDPGLIPGLRSDTAATDAEDQAAMRAAGPGVGKRGGGSVSKQVEGSGSADTSPDRRGPPDTNQTTSAPPDDSGNLGSQIAIPTAYLGAGAIPRILSGNRPTVTPYPTVDNASQRQGFTMEDTPPLYGDMNGINRPQLGGGAGPMPDPGALPPPPTAITPPAPSPLTQALDTATGRALPAPPPVPTAPPPAAVPQIPGPVMQPPQPGAELRGVGINPNSIPNTRGISSAVPPGPNQIVVRPRLPPVNYANPNAGEIAQQVLRSFGRR